MRPKQIASVAAAIVLGSVMVGWFGATRVKSPAQVAAETAPPAASLITVPVRKQTLSAEVVTRGTVRHRSPVKVNLAASALKPSGTALVTLAPQKGTQLDEGKVALATGGRPVFVLAGTVPAFRDLTIGTSGDDVRQLEAALKRLGFDPGALDGLFDAATATAVGAWYTKAGWTPFAPTDAQRLAVAGAADAASKAKQARLQSEVAVARPGSTPAEAQLLTRAVELAREEETAAVLAYLALNARTAVQVPADELLFLPDLPRRVDEVKVQRGDPIGPELMTVSGLSLSIDAALSPNDAKLVPSGAKLTIEEPDLGVTASGVVSLRAEQPGTNGVDAQKFYAEITPENVPASLVGASVKLTIPVKSTAGDVLAVPLSALTVGAGGVTRIQIVDGATTRFVEVVPGLAAQGLVEITPKDGTVSDRDNVVVGAGLERPVTPAAGRTTNPPAPTSAAPAASTPATSAAP
jgi:peptidoglycan hydrolase-like protein with peptidoglycan-binding domain